MGFGVLNSLYLGLLGNHNFNFKMVSTCIVGRSLEFRGEFDSSDETHNGHKVNTLIPLSVSTSRKGLLEDGEPQTEFQVQGTKTTLPSRSRILNFGSLGGLPSPSAKFRQTAEAKDDISQSVPSATRQRLWERFNGVLSQKIDWDSLWKTGKQWISNPLNMVLLLWIGLVAVSGAILFLVMTGMLNGALPKKSQRDTWFEVTNQIINALFTLMCLYQHPKRFHHLVLLCRWKPEDISQLRSIYCKNGTYKPRQRTHMTVVIVLLHVNCFAQYALCGLNLGYKRSERPAIGVGVCLSVAIAAPALAGLYSILSPLGKEYDLEVDEEALNEIPTAAGSWPSHAKFKSLERRFSFASRKEQRIVENEPVWRAGIFDIWEDIHLAYLSIFCTFCVLGWNMERLGFGNMYVHIATFLLFCMAPFWIFNLAAINIDNEAVREALGITGIVLCLFGLFYGGFWRIQMRKRFNLPANNLCCEKPAIADCVQWLFCCWCSLAQEVRTTDFYDIVEDKFCRKLIDENEPSVMSPLPRENGLFQTTYGQGSAHWNSHPGLSKLKTGENQSPRRFSKNNDNCMDVELPHMVEDFFRKDMDKSMKAPIPSFMQREDITN